MKKLKYFITLMMLSSLTYANDGAWNQHQGPYAELIGGTNVGTVLVFGAAKGAGISGALGYQFTPGFGLEVGLMENYLSNNETYTVPIVSTKFTIPLGERLSFITKLGVMTPLSELHGTGWMFTGVGVSYAVTKKLDLGVQYQGAIYGMVNAGLAGISLTYHFT